MDKRQSKVTILVCLIIAVVVVFFGFKARGQTVGNVPIPPAVPEAQASEIISVGSPDGKFNLTMKEKKGQESTTYTFNSEKINFAKTVPTGVTMSIPFNTFSPDNKYVFLKENGLGTTSYTVIAPSGIIDVSSLFEAKYEDFVITDATGWAGPTLLVINTDKEEGGKGPSFWFDVASRSFIQLSNRFD